MTSKDREEFIGYLRACTNAQVQGVYAKESEARRRDYARLARDEARQRGIEVTS